MKLRGPEKFWNHYVDLMAALTNGEDPGEALRAISLGFTARNKDKRLGTDYNRIDGTGYAPVNWDFRVASLARYAKEKYDRDLISNVAWPFEWKAQAPA